MTTDSTPAIGLEGVTLGYSGERLFENLSAQFGLDRGV